MVASPSGDSGASGDFAAARPRPDRDRLLRVVGPVVSRVTGASPSAICSPAEATRVVALVVGRRVVAERRAGTGRPTVSLGEVDDPFDDPATSWVPAPSAGEETGGFAPTPPRPPPPPPPRGRPLRAGAAGPLPP